MKIKDLLEARVPGLEYEEKLKSKSDPTIDKVTLKLAGKDSEIMTKLSNRYKRLDNLQKAITEQRNTMNATVKDKMSDLFDAEDIFRTRVIETISATMTLAKQGDKTPASSKIVVDHEKVAAELLALLEGELLEKGKLILSKYTQTLNIPAQEPKSPALTVKTSESIKEAFSWDAMKAWAGKFLDYFKSWGRSYDQKLAKIVGEMRPMGESMIGFPMSGPGMNSGSKRQTPLERLKYLKWLYTHHKPDKAELAKVNKEIKALKSEMRPVSESYTDQRILPKLHIMSTASSVNTKAPMKNEFVKNWSEGGEFESVMSYLLVETHKNPIVITGSGEGRTYPTVGEKFIMISSQTQKSLGVATVIARSTDINELPSGNYRLWVMK